MDVDLRVHRRKTPGPVDEEESWEKACELCQMNSLEVAPSVFP